MGRILVAICAAIMITGCAKDLAIHHLQSEETPIFTSAEADGFNYYIAYGDQRALARIYNCDFCVLEIKHQIGAEKAIEKATGCRVEMLIKQTLGPWEARLNCSAEQPLTASEHSPEAGS